MWTRHYNYVNPANHGLTPFIYINLVRAWHLHGLDMVPVPVGC